jgi:hypothetical protein
MMIEYIKISSKIKNTNLHIFNILIEYQFKKNEFQVTNS